MKFHDYHSHYQIFRRNMPSHELSRLNPEEFARTYIGVLDEMSRSQGRMLGEVDPITPSLMQLEANWHMSQRPYYNLWPSIIPALTKLKLEAGAEHFTLPMDELLIRFPVAGNPLSWKDHAGTEWSVRSVLCENATLAHDVKGERKSQLHTADVINSTVRGIAFFVDIGEALDGTGKQLYTDDPSSLRSCLYKHIVCTPGRSIEWSFDNIPVHESVWVGVKYPESIVRDIARIVCTLCIMSEDRELVEPIVLKADEDKWDRTQDPTLVEKAKRRGNFGFNVGRHIEVVPHVRAASPAALYWTGEGRRIPRIRFRRGTVVHRKRLASVPTGFLDLEDQT